MSGFAPRRFISPAVVPTIRAWRRRSQRSGGAASTSAAGRSRRPSCPRPPLEGPGEAVVFDELPKGEVTARSVPLAVGTWTVYCGLDGHRERGMRAKLTVAVG